MSTLSGYMEKNAVAAPFFSVILPFYNASATVDAAITSVMRQSFADYELILIDDGSKDDAITHVHQLLEFCLVKNRVISIPENRGVSYARNLGLDSALGRYVAFLDADDIWHIDKLKVMAELISSYTTFGLYYHDCRLATDNQDLDNVNADNTATPRPKSFSSFLLKNPCHTPAAVMRNRDGYRFDEKLRYSEDYQLWLQICYREGALHLPRQLTTLRRPVGAPGGLSEERWRMRLGEMKAYISLCRIHSGLCLLVPPLLFWSALKHLRLGLSSVMASWGKG